MKIENKDTIAAMVMKASLSIYKPHKSDIVKKTEWLAYHFDITPQEVIDIVKQYPITVYDTRSCMHVISNHLRQKKKENFFVKYIKIVIEIVKNTFKDAFYRLKKISEAEEERKKQKINITFGE